MNLLQRLRTPLSARGIVFCKLAGVPQIVRIARHFYHGRQFPSVHLRDLLQWIEPMDGMGVTKEDDMDSGGSITVLTGFDLRLSHGRKALVLSREPVDVMARR